MVHRFLIIVVMSYVNSIKLSCFVISFIFIIVLQNETISTSFIIHSTHASTTSCIRARRKNSWN